MSRIHYCIFMYLLLFCNNCVSQLVYDSKGYILNLCVNSFKKSVSNLDSIIEYQSKLQLKNIINIDTIIKINKTSDFVNTKLSGTNYGINFYVDKDKNTCEILSYGVSGFEKFDKKSMRKIIKSESYFLNQLQDSVYYNLIFTLISPINTCIYKKEKNVFYILNLYERNNELCINLIDKSNSIFKLFNNQDYLIYNDLNENFSFLPFNIKRLNNQNFKIKIKKSNNKKIASSIDQVIGYSDSWFGVFPLWIN